MDYNFYDDITEFGTDDVKAMQSGNMINTDGRIVRAKKVQIPGTQKFAYLKSTVTPKAIGAIASARMYKQIGIATPPITQILFTSPVDIVQSIQPDVSNFEDKEVKLANEVCEFKNIAQDIMGKYKWEMFEDDVKAVLLTKLTPECLIQLQNIFLIDELRSDNDRHYKNYFFYREENAKKWQGVIVIDLEQMVAYDYAGETKKKFNSQFLNFPYSSATLQDKDDYVSFKNRILKIKEMIQTGCLAKENIEALKGALEFDLPGEVKIIAKENGIKGFEIGDMVFGKDYRDVLGPIKQLWAYNREQLGEDLGLEI